MGPNNAIRATVRKETFLTTSLDVKLQSLISQIVREMKVLITGFLDGFEPLLIGFVHHDFPKKTSTS